MSLTTLLESNQAVRELFRATFTKPALVGAPKTLIPPRTPNYRLVGTAFDYLLRWKLQRAYRAAEVTRWVAEKAIQRLAPELRGTATGLIGQAKAAHKEFLASGQATRTACAAVIGLAQLDAVFRSRRGSERVGQVPNDADTADLAALIDAVPGDLFAIKNRCVLNPTFGRASSYVGGADADVVVDDLLVEIKTIQAFELERRTFDELMGYVVLSRIGGFGNSAQLAAPIRRIGVYFARHATLAAWPLETVVTDGRLAEATRWFEAHVITPLRQSTAERAAQHGAATGNAR